jgi:dienelactone hydrolase
MFLQSSRILKKLLVYGRGKSMERSNVFFAVTLMLRIEKFNGYHARRIRFLGIACFVLGVPMYLAACATWQSVGFRSESVSGQVNVTGDLYRPEGNGPFPAVIVLHSCGGAGTRESGIAARLREVGYVTLIVDSFGPRGYGGRGGGCRSGNFANHVSDSLNDALGAAAYLRSLPFVRGDRIGVVGFSLGATSILSLPTDSASRGIKAGASYYPICQSASDGSHFFKDSKLPLLVLLGELDNWSQASACVEKLQQFKKAGRTVEWYVYPTAHHGFDDESRIFLRTDGRGRNMQYNRDAAADSWKRLQEFLEQNLRS